VAITGIALARNYFEPKGAELKLVEQWCILDRAAPSLAGMLAWEFSYAGHSWIRPGYQPTGYDRLVGAISTQPFLIDC
jgi:hypothetical protein